MNSGSGKRVLVVGSGAREHVLAWALARSPQVAEVIAAPGSAGMAQVARCVDVGTGDEEGLAALATEAGVDLVVIGPEAPLVAGLADMLRALGFVVLGPGETGARLEGSKAFAKGFMKEHGIPTASYEVFDDLEAAIEYVRAGEGPLVVKADGLAAGKGVVMAEDRRQAEAALRRIMADQVFGEAGARVVLEEWMRGEEASIFALCDGERFVLLPSSQDHKRIGDGDTGENTGGMGAYSPAPVVTEEVLQQVRTRIVPPTLSGIGALGSPFRGVLYCGLMISPAGEARVVEFNVRFGDPEAQAVLPRIRSDLYPWLEGAARGALPEGELELIDSSAVTVVMASAGYPASSTRGTPISGLAAAAAVPGCQVFHAATALDAQGAWVTAGGRVLGVTAVGAGLAEAKTRAYEAVAQISFDGAQFRTDIAERGIARVERAGA